MGQSPEDKDKIRKQRSRSVYAKDLANKKYRQRRVETKPEKFEKHKYLKGEYND